MSIFTTVIKRITGWEPATSYVKAYTPAPMPDPDAGLREVDAPHRKVIELQRADLTRKMNLLPTDRLTLHGPGLEPNTREVWCDAEIDEAITVDHAVMYRFTDDLGFSHAIGCAFGTKAVR